MTYGTKGVFLVIDVFNHKTLKEHHNWRRVKETITMDQLILPIFPAFDAEVDKSTVGQREDRWVGRLENLFVALQLVDPIVQEWQKPDEAVIKRIDDRKWTLLLHSVDEQTFDIHEPHKDETETTMYVYGNVKGAEWLF